MGFKFNYQSALAYRGHLKEKAEIDFAKTRQQLNRARALLESYQARLTGGRAELETRLRGSFSSDQLRVHLDYLSGLKRRIDIQTGEVRKWQEKTAKKMAVLVEKTKEYKVLEKLKQKDLEQWKYQERHREQKEMNEVAVRRHQVELY